MYVQKILIKSSKLMKMSQNRVFFQISVPDFSSHIHFPRFLRPGSGKTLNNLGFDPRNSILVPPFFFNSGFPKIYV